MEMRIHSACVYPQQWLSICSPSRIKPKVVCYEHEYKWANEPLVVVHKGW